MTSTTVARVGHGLVAVTVAAALLLQLVLVVIGASVLRPEDDPGLAVRLLRLVSYFTIQSNGLVLVASATLVRDPARDGAAWRVIRLDAVTGIVVTGLVHWFLLRPILDLHGASALADTLLHVVVPIAATAGWVVLGPRGRISGRTVAYGLIWPAAWVLCTLAVGAVTGWYPYPFLDVGTLGVGPVALAVSAIGAFLVVVESTLWLLDRVLPWGVPH